MKMKKTVEKDDVLMEVWIYVGNDLRKRLVELLQKVEYRQDWEESIIVPLYKRGNEENRDILLVYGV